MQAVTRVENFIIGASGSDKQMLCRSSGARAAPSISGVNKTRTRQVCHSSYESVPMAWNFKKGECGAMLWSFNLFARLR